jgi:hypothetical protein
MLIINPNKKHAMVIVNYIKYGNPHPFKFSLVIKNSYGRNPMCVFGCDVLDDSEMTDGIPNNPDLCYTYNGYIIMPFEFALKNTWNYFYYIQIDCKDNKDIITPPLDITQINLSDELLKEFDLDSVISSHQSTITRPPSPPPQQTVKPRSSVWSRMTKGVLNVLGQRKPKGGNKTKYLRRKRNITKKRKVNRKK